MRQNRRTFLRNAALTSGAIALRNPAARAEQGTGNLAQANTSQSAEASSADDFRRGFLSPEKKYRPIARWWWPGNLVTDEELRREINVLDKAGFGGAEIQSFIKGFNRADFSDEQWRQMNTYASESFFRHVAAACRRSSKPRTVHRLHLWLWLAIRRRRSHHAGTRLDRIAPDAPFCFGPRKIPCASSGAIRHRR